MDTTRAKKRSPETIKIESRGLRGDLAQALNRPDATTFPKDDLAVLKFHGTLMDELRPTLRETNQALLTTFSACGDIRRNVMACPAPLPGGARAQLRKAAAAIARELFARDAIRHLLTGREAPTSLSTIPVGRES